MELVTWKSVPPLCPRFGTACHVKESMCLDGGIRKLSLADSVPNQGCGPAQVTVISDPWVPQTQNMRIWMISKVLFSTESFL